MTRAPAAALTAVLWVASLTAAQAQGPPAVVPPPLDQRTADCSAPTYATDALVCGDVTLLETDRQLLRLYDEATAVGLRFEGALTESSTEWFRRRSLCAFATDHRACAVAAYRERIGVVQALMAARGGTAPLTVRCGRDEWRGRLLRTAAGIDALVLSDEAGRSVGVALAAADQSGWRVFVGEAPAKRVRELTLVRGDDRRTCALGTSLGGLTDGALRQRVEAIDDLLERAKAARGTGQLDAAAFGAILRWLREEELAVHAEAGLRTFADPATHNYWHRSRLKFPSVTEQELSRLPGSRN